MYPGKVNSPVAVLTASINESSTDIKVSAVQVLPPPPNIAVIGVDTINPEIIRYSSIAGDYLTGVTRAFNADGVLGQAQDWEAGTTIARFFTEYDYAQLISNINDRTVPRDGGRNIWVTSGEPTPISVGDLWVETW